MSQPSATTTAVVDQSGSLNISDAVLQGVRSLPENRVIPVVISERERASGVPSAATVGAAVSTLHRDGIVILENAVDSAHLDAVNKKLSAEVPGLVDDPETHWNQGKEMGNISQPPPFTEELMFADMWANPFGVAVISAILGPRPRVGYVNGNTALPNTHGRQNVHADMGTWSYGTAPVAMVANYYLTDTDEANGATEVWLRSHRHTQLAMHQEGKGWIQPQHIAQRAAESGFPPLRPAVKKGSLVIRDLRLWHAGRSNPSGEARIMLAFVHFPWWYNNTLRVRLPRAVKPFVESFDDRVVYQAEYVEGEVDHKKVFFDGTFKSGNEAYLATVDGIPHLTG